MALVVVLVIVAMAVTMRVAMVVGMIMMGVVVIGMTVLGMVVSGVVAAVLGTGISLASKGFLNPLCPVGIGLGCKAVHRGEDAKSCLLEFGGCGIGGRLAPWELNEVGPAFQCDALGRE